MSDLDGISGRLDALQERIETIVKQADEVRSVASKIGEIHDSIRSQTDYASKVANLAEEVHGTVRDAVVEVKNAAAAVSGMNERLDKEAENALSHRQATMEELNKTANELKTIKEIVLAIIVLSVISVVAIIAGNFLI